jgi:hypothetical protein
MSRKVIEKFDNGERSVTLAKNSFELFEVSWFLGVENAGMLSTYDESHARAAYSELVSKA